MAGISTFLWVCGYSPPSEGRKERKKENFCKKDKVSGNRYCRDAEIPSSNW